MHEKRGLKLHFNLYREHSNLHCSVFCSGYTIPLGTHKKAGKALWSRESLSSISQLLHWNDLECRKNLSPAVIWILGHAQTRHTPREPHTNRDGISLCILPYLNISDFLCFKVYVLVSICSGYTIPCSEYTIFIDFLYVMQCQQSKYAIKFNNRSYYVYCMHLYVTTIYYIINWLLHIYN